MLSLRADAERSCDAIGSSVQSRLERSDYARHFRIDTTDAIDSVPTCSKSAAR